MSGPRSERDIDWRAVRTLIRDRLLALSQPDERVDVDDLVQESCIRLLRATSAEASHNVGGLATVVARRTWVDYIRRKTRNRRFLVATDAIDIERSAADADPSTPCPGETHLGSLRDRIELIVQEIFHERGAEGCLELARAYFDERDWTVVSKELGASYATVRKRWSRCVATLREIMAQDPVFRELFARAGVSAAGTPEA